MTKVILAIIYEAPQFSNILQIFQKLNDEKHYQFMMYCPYYLPNTLTYIRACQENGFYYLYNTTEKGGDAEVLKQIESLDLVSDLKESKSLLTKICRSYFSIRNKCKQIIRVPIGHFKNYILENNLVNELSIFKNRALEIVDYLEMYKSTYDSISAIINSLNPSLLLFTEDVVERDTNIWIKIAHKLDILSIIVSTGTSTSSEAAETYFDNSNFLFPTASTWYIRLLIRIVFRKWYLNYRGKQLLRLPFNQLIAMELMDFAPQLPWINNSGDGDLILVECKFTKELQVNQGIKNNRIKIFGSLKFDFISSIIKAPTSYRHFIYQKYNLCLDKKLILCAFPSYLPDRKLPYFESYEDMINRFTSSLKSSKYNVIYSVHPSGFPHTFNTLKSLGHKVLEEETINIIPLCDIYIASVSSTIKWARACNKLVLDYDCFGFNYDIYKKDSAIVSIKSYDEFLDWIERLNNKSLSEIIGELNKQLPPSYWGNIDGKSLNRLRVYIETLIK